MTLDFISRFIHIGTAITLIGGSAFMFLVLMPAAKSISDDAHRQLAEAVRTKWKRFVHAGIALFLLSGGYNFYRALPNHDGDKLYHMLVGIKILLALFVFFIASALVGTSSKLEPMRKAKAKWLAVMLLLAIAIVGISSYVKIRGPQVAIESENAATALEAAAGESTSE